MTAACPYCGRPHTDPIATPSDGCSGRPDAHGLVVGEMHPLFEVESGPNDRPGHHVVTEISESRIVLE